MRIEKASPPNSARVRELLAKAPEMRIVVLGDFFLDKYLVTDPKLSEPSVETGLEARQVVLVRCSPGAAGPVTNNLAAMNIGEIRAISSIGEDGEGYELLKGLTATGVRTGSMLRTSDRFTPTYAKPMVITANGEIELERLDIKNRMPLSPELEGRLIQHLQQELAGGADAVILLDQVSERNCGVFTDCVREHIAGLAVEYPNVLFFADSRERIGEFKAVTIKPNIHEAAKALGIADKVHFTVEESVEIGSALAERNDKLVYLTTGQQGIVVCERQRATHVPALPVDGPIDIVGAGDSATAGIVTTLIAGASPVEAAYSGNLCAAVTIRKLGTTGTASPAEILALIDS